MRKLFTLFTMCLLVDCIVKPADGSLGIGVEKLPKQDDPVKIKALYEKWMKKRMVMGV